MLCGVIEGFYGRPWTLSQRENLFQISNKIGLNCFIYGPKDDDKHRNYWRQLYNEEESKSLGILIQKAQANNIQFFYALSPGLDITFSDQKEISAITSKFDQLISLGCSSFALFFDDIPHKMSTEDAEKFKSFAQAQAHVSNEVFSWLSKKTTKPQLLFCPTEYCRMMAVPSVSESEYLKTVGNDLHPDILLMWTGDDIISKTITVDSLQDLITVIKRKPFIWDNLYANDYDIRRIYLGPFKGRPQEIINYLSGLVINPNCEYAANFNAFQTTAMWSKLSTPYDPSKGIVESAKLWLPYFKSRDTSQVFTVEEILQLIDSRYLPHEHGSLAQEHINLFKKLRHVRQEKDLENNPQWERFQELSKNFISIFRKLTYIEDRDLLYTLYKYQWEIKEEMHLLLDIIQHLSKKRNTPAYSPFHKPGTFRGGFVADIQRLYDFDITTGGFTPPKTIESEKHDLGDWKIVPYSPEHYEGLLNVCLKTGNSGDDGTHLFPGYPHIIGERYAVPYAVLQPDLAFTLINTTIKEFNGVCGYTLAAFDTKEFNNRYLTEWIPKMQQKYPKSLFEDTPKESRSEAQQIMSFFHNPQTYFPPKLEIFKSHLHIDLLQNAQGQGLGTLMIKTMLDAIREKGSTAVHLCMGSTNFRALSFYKKLGFVVIAHVHSDTGEDVPFDFKEPHDLYLGMTL